MDREHPQRTGLVLSAGVDEDQGFFTLADVLELDLDAILVSLSACETARGEIRAGEGVQSMARAFLYAGARTVLASLWKVSDDAAALTMEELYRKLLLQGLPVYEALQQAKLTVRKARGLRGVSHDAPDESRDGHPFFWAPFISIGLPR